MARTASFCKRRRSKRTSRAAPTTDPCFAVSRACYRARSMRLHINVDHVATLRNARGTPYPDPVEAARVCLEAGAHGITAHLREDRRHIHDEDVKRLRASLRATFNLEM